MMDLLNLEPVKAPEKATDYSMMVIGESKIGKTTFVSEFYGKEDTLFLATENRHKALTGAYVKRIANWTEFLSVLKMLKMPKVKEKYKNVVIDTIDNLYIMMEDYVVSKYDETILGQADKRVNFSEDYRLFDALLKKVKDIDRLGYNLILISHTVDTTKTVYYDRLTQEEKNELASVGITESVKDKKGMVTYSVAQGIIKKKKHAEFLTGLVDNVLFLSKAGVKNDKRVIYTRPNMFNECASSTFKDIAPVIELDAKAYRAAVDKCIGNLGEENINKDYQPQDYTLDYDKIYQETKEVGSKLYELGKMDKVQQIADDLIGDGASILDLKENNVEVLNNCLAEMKSLLEE